MNDTPESRSFELRKMFLTFLFILVGLSVLTFVLVAKYHVQHLKKVVVATDAQLDAEYVKGFEAALDCRSLLSAPACEIVLEKAGR
jgi:hypothetical protein